MLHQLYHNLHEKLAGQQYSIRPQAISDTKCIRSFIGIPHFNTNRQTRHSWSVQAGENHCIVETATTLRLNWQGSKYVILRTP